MIKSNQFLIISVGVFVCICSSTFGQTPIPPTNPIFILTSIGEVAGSNDKIAVSVMAQVDGNKSQEMIQIEDKAMMGGKFNIPSSDASEIARLLEEASDKLLSGQIFSGKAGKANLAVAEVSGQKRVIIEFEVDGISFASRKLLLDADNASSLARILKRAKQVSDWLSPKYNVFYPKP
jgi:hypothetical protein